MYKTLSELSFLIRVYLCYLTIDKISIFANEMINYIILEIISLYTILRIITYTEVNIAFGGEVDTIGGTILYFIIYVINLIIMYFIMFILTKFGILPI